MCQAWRPSKGWINGLVEGKILSGNHRFSHEIYGIFRFLFSLKTINWLELNGKSVMKTRAFTKLCLMEGNGNLEELALVPRVVFPNTFLQPSQWTGSKIGLSDAAKSWFYLKHTPVQHSPVQHSWWQYSHLGRSRNGRSCRILQLYNHSFLNGKDTSITSPQHM